MMKISIEITAPHPDCRESGGVIAAAIARHLSSAGLQIGEISECDFNSRLTIRATTMLAAERMAGTPGRLRKALGDDHNCTVQVVGHEPEQVAS
jgi:hypothetical protein